MFSNLKTLINSLIGLICGLICLNACTKEGGDIPDASYQNAVWFYADATNVLWSGASDSAVTQKIKNKFRDSMNFYYMGDTVSYYDYSLPTVRLMGNTADYDREFKLEAVSDSTTAIEGVHYQFVKNVMPAGAVTTVPTIRILRATDLANGSVTLHLRIVASDEFPAEVADDTVSRDHTFIFSRNVYLSFKDMIAKPPYWDDLRYFGTWSRVKAEFMKEILGFDLGLEPVSTDDYGILYNYYLQLRSALARYNANNPTLTDENGIAVYI